VRKELLAFQRSFSRREGGAVLDGRDIGTVICPKAEFKLFVTANVDVRADRRYRELRSTGTDITLEQVLLDVLARDARDADRATAPMIPAKDAVVIDTSELSVDEAISDAISLVQNGMKS
ncbi:MAG: (d)CMP kinase, partial [Planktomarina sp.]|nr:(d)CMP kinase [Planktomarina sp.]